MKKNRTKIKKSTKIMSGIMSFALLWNLIPTQIIMAVPEDEEPTEIATGEPVDEDIPDEQQIGNETDTEQNTDLTDDTENNTPGDDVESGEDNDVTNDNDEPSEEPSDNQENNDPSEEQNEPTDNQEEPTENPSDITPVQNNDEETNDDQVQDADPVDDKNVPEENNDAEPSDDKEGLEENKDDEKKEPEENKDSESSDDKKEEPLDEKSDAKKSGDDLNSDNTKSGAKSNSEEPSSDDTDSEDSSNSGLRGEPTRGGDTPIQTEWVFNYTQEFIDYCSSTYLENPSGHQHDTLIMPFTLDTDATLGVLTSEYIGLGTSEYPFAGTIYLVDDGAGYFVFTNNGDSFFNYVMDSVSILRRNSTVPVQIRFKRTTENVGAGKSFPLLAQHVISSGNPTNWDVQLISENIKEYSGVIGEIHDGATVNLKFTNNSGVNVISNAGTGTSYVADVGAVCGKIDTGATLNLDFTESSSNYSITSSNGNAGGLVGTMEGTAVLNIKNMPAASVSKSVVSDLGYAGGIVGKLTSSASVTLDSSSSLTEIAVAGSVTGSAGAGGLYGYYENTITNEFDISGYNCTAEVYGINCGGLFGLLKNDKGSGSAVTLTIKNTVDAGVVNISSGSGSTYASTGYFGGIAGKYTTDSLTNSLVLDDFNVTVASNASFAAFGGVIGCVDSASYITADDLQITATGTAKKDSDDYFGGLIGKNSNTGGVFVDLGDFKVTSDSDGYKGGGIIGNFAKGVLRLKGTTDMSSAKSKKGGQLVGVNNNVLIYALGSGTNGTSSVRNGTTNEITTPASGWTFKRSNASQVDDLGTWGEVVRISNIEDSTNGIVTLDTTNHTVTLKAAQTSMGTQTDLVKTALNIQLNQGSDYDCLKFMSESNTRADLLSATLSLAADLSFVGTGITGFMRDGSDSVGEFTGTLNGGSYTITLAIGEVYGLSSSGSTVSSSNEGAGQIYCHPYNGLFAVIGNGTTGTGIVNALTIAGSINVRNKIDGMNIGGIAAISKGHTTLNGITANQTVNYCEPSSVSVTITEADGKNIGGLIGLAKAADNGTIAVTGTNAINTTFNISNEFKSWACLGAFIGKVTSNKFTINIAQGTSDKLTVSHTMSGSFTAGANADGGGLIGYITSGTYSDRKININNLDFDGCTIINRATSNGGGFLGYTWLDTDTTIAGMTVTDGTINNSSPNVGIMCYEATGRWIVDNLTVTKMSLSGGAGTSLGMLVNKAYSDTKGLYLNVLKSGYTLTDKNSSTGITLPNSLGIYDELAAYSASDVIKGTNAGVISINMNTDRSGTNTKIRDYDTSTSTESGTGTYQNQLTSASSSALVASKYANVKSRYYYNLDKMSNSDATQNIVLWSVNKYAASNINGLFSSTNSPFSNSSETNIDLSCYSYYPVDSISTMTLKNINLNFGYSGIYDVEGNSTFNTDGYNRDPGASNQHYLMQSGLFINGSEGSTLTLNNVKLSGDFLENGTYRGVLFSGETKGSISVDGLALDGITPKYNNSGTISNYTDGYLLVKKINRADAQKKNIQITLQDISTTNKYTKNSLTSQVSQSLIGDVYGPAVGISISAVKLDARSSSSALTGSSKTALDYAYGTVNSIFTQATLFKSIKTSQEATLKYNYELEEDWGSGNRKVTYGKEVSESVEYSGRENKYYNGSCFTDPTNNNASSPYNFDTNWLPYVGTAYSSNHSLDSNGCFDRELKVNVPATAYPDGCGTYNDPYVIDSGDKLEAIASLISDSSKTDNLNSLRLPKTLYSGIAANTTGNRWCEGQADHAIFTYKTNTNKYESDEAGVTAKWNVNDVRLYLANAYYIISSSSDDISGNIVLDDYLGLGGTDSTGKYAFRGVIVGNSKTIINNSSNPLVKVSNGCVVKDLTVKQNVDITMPAQDSADISTAYFGYNSFCQYYGGIIGEIMGGDNIIDNSYVDFENTKITITGTYSTLVPVGGYVGVIVFGGLIFKNMDASKTTLASTGINVVNDVEIPASTHAVTDDANNLADKTVVFKHGDSAYMTSNVNTSNSSRHGFATNGNLNQAVTIVFEKKEGTTNNYYLKMNTVQEKKYLQLYNGPGLRLGNKGEDGTLFTVEKNGSQYTFKATNTDYYINWNSGRGFSGANTVYPDNNVYLEEFDEVVVCNLTDDSGQEAWAAIYVNPLVGRVINGYAINETETDNVKGTTGRFSVTENNHYHNDEKSSRTGSQHSLKNGVKHYSIADVNRSEQNKLLVNIASSSVDGTISVPNSQALFILSLITQSCAGTANTASGDYNNSLSYGSDNNSIFGMSHNAEYSSVGLAISDTDGDYLLACNDTAAKTAVPYIVRWYTDVDDGTTARCVTGTDGYYDITLTGSGTYQLPDSFRGLGCVGNYNVLYNMKVDCFSGAGRTIDEDIYINKYQIDNYFGKLHNGTTQAVNSNLSAYNVNHETYNHGIGLVDDIKTKNTSSTISNFTITGSVNTEIYDNTYKTTSQELALYQSENAGWLSVGGVVGTGMNESNIVFDRIILDGLSVCGSSIVGGIMGFSCNKGDYYIEVNRCSTDNIHGLSVKMNSSSASETDEKGRNAIGGLIGKCFECKVNIYGTAEKENNETLSNYSTVRLNSFGFEASEVQKYRCCAGGLVGFAGDGCQAYDMYVVSNSISSPVTIGSEKINFAGGICGGMQSRLDGTAAANQPYTPTCYATFKNCTVDNINILGQMVGGFYGGKWGATGWTPYSITIDNCKMVGNSTNKNTIEAVSVYNSIDIYAGGFIGRGLVLDNGNPNIHIKDSVVSDYVIQGKYCGGFIGFAGSYKGGTTITCYIHDSSVEDCVIGASGDYAGGAIGHVVPKNSSTSANVTANKMLGYNIKLDNVTSQSNKMGAWIGYLGAGKTSIQFAGIGIYGAGFSKNVGGTASNAESDLSFVFADYSGQCNGVADNVTPAIASYNHTTGVGGNSVYMPKYPYVNIFPQSSMGTGEIISGDGAVLGRSASNTAAYSGKTAERTMALKLYEDMQTNAPRSYTTFKAFNDTDSAKIYGDNKIEHYMKQSADVDGDRISNYYAEKGYTSDQSYDNFACIVIANTTHAETTALINRYAQLVTNTTTDYIGTDASNTYFDIELSTCKLENGNFVVDTTKTESQHGLILDNNQLCLNSSYADSMSSTDSFTLVDIQFKDPLNTNKIAYHLYIPVYTIKQMTYDFATTTVTGTSPNNSVYSDLNNPSEVHADSVNTWITEYVRFTYKEADIQDLLDSNSLNWNVDKVISYSTLGSAQKLPDNTRMILVDPNGDADKMYKATVSASTFDSLSGNGGWKIEFDRFVDTSYPTPIPFEPSKFSDMLSKSITRISGDKYVQSDEDDYDLCYYNNGIKEYYSYVGTDGTCSFDANGDFNEDYFISFWVPDTDSSDDLYFYRVNAENVLTGGKTLKLNVEHTQNIIIADLYEQNVEQFVVETTEQQITATDNTIDVRVASTISIPNESAINRLDAVDLYHSFNLLLNRYEENGSVSSNIYGLDPSRITARYGIETGTYDGNEAATFVPRNIAIEGNDIVIETEEIMDYLLNGTITIYADITMEFDPDYLSYEFPNKTTEDAPIGVNVSASSNLSYQDDTERLAHSTITKSFGTDNKYFYVNAVNSALLSYSAINELDYYDTDGRQSQNQSRLGLNGRSAEMTMMPIHTEANYNVDIISNWQSGDKIRLTLSLDKKTDTIEGGVVVGADYVEVDIVDFLTITSVTSGNVTFTKNNELSNAHKLVYEANSAGCEMVSEGYYHFDIAFTAHTGEGFEDYANFKLNLQAELRDTLHGDARTVENSSARDYIVYTNAKIFNDVINQGQINQGNP